MKQHFSILLAALALTCALTACGSKQNNDQNDARHDTPSADSGLDTVIPGQDDDTVTAPGQSPAITDDTGRSDTADGVPIDEMLENARVHDRDGDLLDGENHITSGADHW